MKKIVPLFLLLLLIVVVVYIIRTQTPKEMYGSPDLKGPSGQSGDKDKETPVVSPDAANAIEKTVETSKDYIKNDTSARKKHTDIMNNAIDKHVNISKNVMLSPEEKVDHHDMVCVETKHLHDFAKLKNNSVDMNKVVGYDIDAVTSQ